MPRRIEPSEEDVLMAWTRYLDGYPIRDTHQHRLEHLSLATVKAITEGPPPESLKDDLRLRGHYYGYMSAKSSDQPALNVLVFRAPVRTERGVFSRGMKELLRMAKDDIPGLVPHTWILDRFDGAQGYDQAERLLLRNPEVVGPGYAINPDGTASRLTEADLHLKREDLLSADAPPPDLAAPPMR